MLKRVVQRVLRSIPRQVRNERSYRLVRDGRYLSVNAGNHLIFRPPAYSDDGKRQEADLYLIWPQSIRISVVSQHEWPRTSTGHFAAIPCFDIALNFADALSLRPNEWQTFGQACYDALYVKRTRRWVSNVTLD